MELDFGQLGCQWEAIQSEVEPPRGKWQGLCLRSRVHHIPRAPEMSPDQGPTIRAWGLRLVIPGRHRNRDLPVVAQPQGQHGDERAHSQEEGGGAGHRRLRPLALGCHPEMGPGLFTGHLDRPALQAALALARGRLGTALARGSQEALSSRMRTVIQCLDHLPQDGLDHDRSGHRHGSSTVTRMEVESA
jgi:hypothetical protein